MRISVRVTAFAIGAAALSTACGSDRMTSPTVNTVSHAPFPTLPFNGGLVLTSARLVVIVPANHDRADSLFLFARALPQSAWARAVNQPYGAAIQSDVTTIIGPAVTDTGITATALQAYVASVVATAGLPAATQTVYLVFEPSVATLSGPFCDYHRPYDSLGNSLAVVSYCNQASLPLASLTAGASHEVAESVSDPQLTAWVIPKTPHPPDTTPWAFDDGLSGAEENADMCVGTRYVESGFTYQRIWSNAAASAGGDPCVPTVNEPYYNLTTPAAWHSTTNGVATITLTGWSTTPIEDWIVGASVDASTPTPTITITAKDTIVVGGHPFPAVNSGGTATVRVTFPPGATPPSFAVLHVASQRLNASRTGLRAGEDNSHGWVIGVYVP